MDKLKIAMLCVLVAAVGVFCLATFGSVSESLKAVLNILLGLLLLGFVVLSIVRGKLATDRNEQAR
ncbi:MAG: hypothetical protein IKY83_13575 [Proteobacteria bacterium]|nr:hypothetical protein [Pseudomonadota bacterium]